MKISKNVWDKFSEKEKEFIINNQEAGLTHLKKFIKIINKKFKNQNIKYINHYIVEVNKNRYKIYDIERELLINVNTLEIM